jgi:metal-responsive CopG/Arc/MetJ family transcriptional regulator
VTEVIDIDTTNLIRSVMAKGKEPESQGVSVRLPSHLLKQIDSLAEQERRTRGNMIRLLLEDALNALKQRGAR